VVAGAGSAGSTLAGAARAALGQWSAPARVLVGFGACAVVAALMGVVREDVALLGMALAGAIFAARRGSVARVAAIAQARRAAAASGAVDLLGAALMAGLNGHVALLRIAERVPPELADEFRLVAADLRLGRTPAVALRGAAERTGLAELRAAAGALHAAERWGAPAAEALAARSEALRTRLRLEAEAGAGRAAVKLAFPLVICFLPAFVLLTVVPLVAGALRAAGF
jgi:tight adherence protein C